MPLTAALGGWLGVEYWFFYVVPGATFGLGWMLLGYALWSGAQENPAQSEM